MPYNLRSRSKKVRFAKNVEILGVAPDYERKCSKRALLSKEEKIELIQSLHIPPENIPKKRELAIVDGQVYILKGDELFYL